jgi:Uma2 family endonuclease
MPLPKPEHGRVTGRVALPLLMYEQETDRVTVLTNDAGVMLERDPDTVRGPDVAVYLTAELPPRPWTSYFTVPPVLAAEIASPSDRLVDIEEKIADYIRAGVKLIWYIFPQTRSVWVDGINRERAVLTENDVLDASDILPGIPPIPIATILR